jgi:uncharacterized protein (DUF1800 family)
MITRDLFIAYSRFGLGPRPEDLKNAPGTNAKSWLRNQISAPFSIPENLKNLPSHSQFTRQFFALRGMKDQEANKDFRQQTRGHYEREMKARFEAGLQTPQPFLERLVLFWSNHFTISLSGKPVLSGIAGAYEREAIRPHVLGNFADMLLAVARHPAMLIYLDNAQSIGPNSIAGRRREKGLNENLAREILELHTLGVAGGYTQDDVIALAKIITGWSLDRKGSGSFNFLNAVHEPGAKTLLGKIYDQGGEQEGIAALRDLALHPSTARFLATKLARHFISDTPQERDVAALASAYQSSGGSLKAVYETLIGLSAAWSEPLPKVKTPYELVLSTMRLMNVQTMTDPEFKRVAASLLLFQHAPFTAPSPAGWPDIAAAWISPDALMNRLEWCHALALKLPIDEAALAQAISYVSSVSDPESVTWMRRAPSLKEGLALVLSSPAHQRR